MAGFFMSEYNVAPKVWRVLISACGIYAIINQLLTIRTVLGLALPLILMVFNTPAL